MTTHSQSIARPLEGLRVLDFTALLPGPLCTLHLADLGAEVIKVEAPKAPDGSRGLPGQQFTKLFLMLARGKQCVAVDLRTSEGQAAIATLAATCEVVVEGFRPGVAERLGIGYAALSVAHSALVYCSISGYGQTGPLRDAGGHDINYQSLAGVLDQQGAAGGAPAQGNFPAADIAGGALSAAVGILAAVLAARTHGRGCHVDVSMTDCVMAQNIPAAMTQQTMGRAAKRGQDYLSGGLPCYGTFGTSDGRYMALGALEMKFWQNWCEAVGRPDLVPQGHAQGNAAVPARAAIAEVIAEKTQAEWVAQFATVDACFTPVLTLDEALVSEHVKARGMVRQVEHPELGAHWQFASPWRFNGEAPLPPAREAVAVGADNAVWLGD
jgi:crotonobetainyl-CoA:carnitine CoA-transferase CaiB-like acyl-CoA transferase